MYMGVYMVETMQNRALRFFLGVHTFAPNHAIKYDMDLIAPHIRHKIEMLRYWNRLTLMDDNRLTKRIFLMDKQLYKK